MIDNKILCNCKSCEEEPTQKEEDEFLICDGADECHCLKEKTKDKFWLINKGEEGMVFSFDTEEDLKEALLEDEIYPEDLCIIKGRRLRVKISLFEEGE